jgi:hypothetical protein
LYEALFINRAEELNESNVLERLTCGELIGHLCETEQKFAASHFFSLDQSSICELSVSILLAILHNESLKVETEDCLYEIISSLISRDPCYSILLECVEYEYLSRDVIESFVNVISESFEYLTIDVWHRLRSRLISGCSSSMADRHHGQIFRYREGSPFDGIIAFLALQHGGNIHELGIVSVTSSDLCNGLSAKFLVVLKDSSIGYANGRPNAWICYDFKEKQVNVSHYSLRSRTDYNHSCHLMNWTIEGSVDGTEWVELDRQNDCRDLVGLNRSNTFSASGNGFFQLIRLRQTGKDSSGDDYFVMSAIELFGILCTARE